MSRRRPSDKESRSGHSQRQLRVGEEIRHLLAELLERGNMRDPDLRDATITVTSVDVSPDLRNATAFVMPLGGKDSEKILAALKRAAPWFRGRVGEKAGLRSAPDIRFRLDRTFDEADRIGALLRLWGIIGPAVSGFPDRTPSWPDLNSFVCRLPPWLQSAPQPRLRAEIRKGRQRQNQPSFAFQSHPERPASPWPDRIGTT